VLLLSRKHQGFVEFKTFEDSARMLANCIASPIRSSISFFYWRTLRELCAYAGKLHFVAPGKLHFVAQKGLHLVSKALASSMFYSTHTCSILDRSMVIVKNVLSQL
jgi:hypothetical protein